MISHFGFSKTLSILTFPTIFLNFLAYLPLSWCGIPAHVNQIINQESAPNKLASESYPSKLRKKDWTIITFMAADNDLARFGRKTLIQQAQIGSNDNVNLVIYFNSKTAANKKVVKRYFVEKNRLVLFESSQEDSGMDSGSPDVLIDTCTWAIENFPANHYALIFWNHGTGVIDIDKARSRRSSPLYNYNTLTNTLELDRSIGYLDYITIIAEQEGPKGICFDDTTNNYMNNQGLERALRTIRQKCLNNQKFDLIAMDACLMSMIEVASLCKDHADYMVASQEVEPGPGYDYSKILMPMETESLNPSQLAQHIVKAYEEYYNNLTNDYTQSALDLSFTDALEQNIDTVARLLLECIQIQKNNSVDKALRISRHKLLCTHFDEPTYVDIHHLYTNILSNLENFSFNKPAEGIKLKENISQTLMEGIALINNMVISNVTGKNLAKAKGISIYFPEVRMHPSYPRSQFGKKNTWLAFISHYLMQPRDGDKR